MFKVIFLFLSLLPIFAQDSNESNTSPTNNLGTLSYKKEFLEERLGSVNQFLGSDNVWLREYHNHNKYKEAKDTLDEVESEINDLTKRKTNTKSHKDKLEELEGLKETLLTKIELLSDFKDPPFSSITKPIDLGESPDVTNPIVIITALSYLKQIKQKKDEFAKRYEDFVSLIERLEKKLEIMQELYTLTNIEEYSIEIDKLKVEIDTFKSIAKLSSTTLTLNTKKVDDVSKKITEKIKAQGKQALYIAISIVILLLISLFIKLILKRYIVDNDRYYKSNKIINFINFAIVVFILLFAYLENVSYLVTVLGFASAGIAIAMKDMFMSILGWFVIVIGGSFQVGDRMKVTKDGRDFVGDILDISFLRITLQEDITLLTYTTNRRAGRIIFVPNHFIFSSVLANYSHSSLKTVWDGIDIMITFDSNHKKAAHIVKNITKKYSKGYTDITRKQLNKLRDKYSLRNTNVEPRILTFIEPYGIKISTWYLTNAYATLTLRSTISSEILDAFIGEPDITIAYPTQTVNTTNSNLQTTPNIPDIPGIT